MVMNDSQGELVTTITQILVRMVILAVKYVIFINVYTTSLLKPCVFRFDVCGRIIKKAMAFLGMTIIYSVRG